MRVYSTVANATLVAALSLFLISCDDQDGNQKQAPADTQATSTAPSATETASSDDSTASPAACTASDLTLSAGVSDAGMMKNATAFAFTNSGDEPCSVEGYPVVILLDGEGEPLMDVAQTNAPSSYFFSETSIEPVTLASGDSAGFGVQLTGQTTETPCKTIAELRALPPGSEIGTEGTEDLTVSFQNSYCGDLTVVPIRAGKISQDDY